MKSNCYHCGIIVQGFPCISDEKVFCSDGCENVYTIIKNHGLSLYYDMDTFPGNTPKNISATTNLLLDESLQLNLVEFWGAKKHLITLFVPNIKGSSCIWLLENLHVIFKAILKSKVNFHTKNVRITYNSQTISAKELLVLLTKLGYPPYIPLGHPN